MTRDLDSFTDQLSKEKIMFRDFHEFEGRNEYKRGLQRRALDDVIEMVVGKEYSYKDGPMMDKIQLIDTE